MHTPHHNRLTGRILLKILTNAILLNIIQRHVASYLDLYVDPLDLC